jgi:hypothetical protein
MSQVKFAAKGVGYHAPNIKEFDMTTQFLSNPRLAALTRVALSVALALAVPQRIVAAAPPAPGTAEAFLVWF